MTVTLCCRSNNYWLVVYNYSTSFARRPLFLNMPNFIPSKPNFSLFYQKYLSMNVVNTFLPAYLNFLAVNLNFLHLSLFFFPIVQIFIAVIFSCFSYFLKIFKRNRFYTYSQLASLSQGISFYIGIRPSLAEFEVFLNPKDGIERIILRSICLLKTLLNPFLLDFLFYYNFFE